jgi:hypothetical protein
MMSAGEWTKSSYESSTSSRCWWFTPYDAGWDDSHRYGRDLRDDGELREIVAMEWGLGPLPEWARDIVEGAIRWLPPCGHYLFPRAYCEAAAAIGSAAPPVFIHGCYTVERGRKERMADYLLCLDAWLAGAGAKAPAAELAASSSAPIDWPSVCSSLWQVLGDRTETKELLVERILHRQRWWLKSMAWDDDTRDRWCRDQYLGDTQCGGDHYGNPSFRDPYFVEQKSPRIEWIESRLKGTCENWEWFRTAIDESWLCAPKAFRFLERMVWAVGAGRPAADEVPSYLQCDDTYPNAEATAAWWRVFLDDLRSWWRRGECSQATADLLGESTPVKTWLVRLLVRRLELCESEELAKLVRPQAGARRGSGPLFIS